MSKIEKPELSMDELDVVEAKMARELTDAELEAVAGGKGDTNIRRPGRRPGRRPRRR